METKSCKPASDHQNFQSILFNLHYKLRKREVCLEDIGDYMPGSVMVQDLGSLTNTYMNKCGCDILKQSREELAALGPLYFDRFFPVEEMRILKPELLNFIKHDDHSATYSFFQRVRADDGSDYKWYFTTSQIYPAELEGNASRLIHVAVEVNNVCYAAKKVNQLCEQENFVRRNYTRFSCLSRREKEIIKLIAEGHSSYQISEMLFISTHTVNNHRKNIVHKLDVKSLSELIRFAMAFFII